MKVSAAAGWRVLVMTGLLFCADGAVRAQAPAGSTGQCNDNSYTNAAKKWQACRGHQGVKTWFADASKGSGAAPAAAAAPAAPAAAAAPAPAAPASARPAAPSTSAATAASGKKMSPEQRAAATPQAPGGGNGMVWVNTDTKVYHCQGSTFYGKTKTGKYMTEADAKAAGAHPDHNKPCTK